MNESADTTTAIAGEIATDLLELDEPPSDWHASIEDVVAERCPDLPGTEHIHILNRVITRLNDQLNLSLATVTLHAPPGAIAPLRDDRWAQEAATIIDLRLRLDALLEQSSRTPDPASLPRIILASAALRGGLFRFEALLALANQLASGQVTLCHADLHPGLVSVELDLTIPRTDQKTTNTEPGREHLRWFPDVLTLAQLDRWRRCGARPFKAPKSVKALYHNILSLLDAEELVKTLPPARFTSAAVASLEGVSGIALPVGIEAVVSGQWPGLSVLYEHWHGLCTGGQAVAEPPIAGTTVGKKPIRPQNVSKRVNTGERPEDERQAEFKQALQHALDTHASTSSRSGTKALSDALYLLQQAADGWPAFEALLSWYRKLLSSGDKPGTIKGYHSIVGKHILAVLHDIDPYALDSEVFRDLFERTLARSNYAEPGHPLGRLAHFAAHAHRVLDWPDADLAEIAGPSKKNSASFVRTAMFPMAVYPEVFDAILKTQDLRRDMAECYAVAFALLAWGGLRIGEAEGRVVDDIGTDLTVFVHATSGHGLKSEAARRLIPLAIFAPPDVSRRVRKFAARRRGAPDPGSNRLLDLGTLFPDDRFKVDTFRRLLDQTLGRMLDMPVRPHDFRHTLISAVHLLFQLGEDGSDTIQAVTGWPAEKQSQIRRALLGPVPDPSRAARQLSALAGHRELSPVSSSTYCHLSDLALGRLILGAPERMCAKKVARVLGLNARSLPPIDDEDDTIRLEDLRLVLLKRMKTTKLSARTGTAQIQSTAPDEPSVLDAERIHAVLRLAESDRQAFTIAERLDLTLPQVEMIVRAARQRMATLTQKNGVRLIPGQGTPALLPVARFAASQKEAQFLGRLLREAGRCSLEGQRVWSETVLERSDRHRQYLRFQSADAARSWLDAFPEALPRSALNIVILCPENTCADVSKAAWRKAIGPLAKYELRYSGCQRSTSPTAPAIIRIRSGKRERRSFATLRRAAFCIAVATDVA